MTADFWADAEVIHVYSRADAIRDGVLVAIEDGIRAEAGIRFPVAMTIGAWLDAVQWTPEHDARKPGGFTGQDQTGRLWDVLWMTRWAISRARPGASSVTVELYRVPPTGKGTVPRKIRLVASVGPGDEGEPVITLLLPGED